MDTLLWIFALGGVGWGIYDWIDSQDNEEARHRARQRFFAKRECSTSYEAWPNGERRRLIWVLFAMGLMDALVGAWAHFTPAGQTLGGTTWTVVIIIGAWLSITVIYKGGYSVEAAAQERLCGMTIFYWGVVGSMTRTSETNG